MSGGQYECIIINLLVAKAWRKRITEDHTDDQQLNQSKTVSIVLTKMVTRSLKFGKNHC